jgi:hypothetical protein
LQRFILLIALEVKRSPVIGSIPQLASSASTASISQPNSSYPQHLQNIGDPLPKHRIIIVLPHY